MQFMALLVLTVPLIAAQETDQKITLESLDDGPGILPFRLGATKLITHYHTFLQYIQIKDIDLNIRTLQGQLDNFRKKLDNNTYTLYEIQLEYLSNKLQSVNRQLLTIKPGRVKRGLIDGLGSIIKSITGNLDYEDAVRYDNTIKTLQENDYKTTEELNNHISLSKEWMAQHTEVIEQLVANQVKINNTLKLLLDRNAHKDYSLIRFAKFGQCLTILAENMDEVLNELVRIENMLAFIHSSSVHHSMISIEVLRHMVDRLVKIYGRDKVIGLELREYYDIIKPGYYYSGTQIVIIFKFPIFAKEIYNLYKLSIAPNKFRQSLIPPYPLIATNRNGYVYIEAECPKYSNWYLCEEKMNHQLRQDPDCMQKLIMDQSLDGSCKIVTISLSKIAMEELDEKHYVISFPNATQIHTSCGREEYTLLNGSYLATIPVNCFLYTPEFTITNLNDHVEGQPIRITKLSLNTEAHPEAVQFNLNSIDLTKLHNTQYRIMSQPPLREQPLPVEYLYHTTIPFYIVLSCTIALSTFIIRRRCKKPKSEVEKPSAEDKIYVEAGASGVSKTHSAIFSQFKLQK